MTPREQAAWWVTELREATPAIEQDFAEWLQQSPRHVEEYLLVDALWRQMDGVDPQRSIDVDAIIARAGGKATITKITPLGRFSRLFRPANAVSTRSRVKRTVAVAAAAACMMVSAFVAWSWLAAQDTYATAVGEQRAVKLDDGSFIYLNTLSRVEVDYTGGERNVRLISGEALFSVAHDATRPFRVHSGGTVVQAIGTQFNVYRRDGQTTTVSVVEGTVQITGEQRPAAAIVAVNKALTQRSASTDRSGAPPLRITAGEQAEIATSGNIEKRARGDIEQAIAWRSRRLVFRSESLAEIAEQFNRYNEIKIRVEGESVRHRKLIGTFNADDPTSLIKFLAGEADLRAQEINGELVIAPR